MLRLLTRATAHPLQRYLSDSAWGSGQRRASRVAANPGMSADTFRAVFAPAGPKLAQRRYRLRWDWHVRNFLMALIPPAALYAMLKAVEWRYDGEDDVHKWLYGEDSAAARHREKEKSRQSLQGGIEGRIQVLEAELRKIREEREREVVLQRARVAAKDIVRNPRESD